MQRIGKSRIFSTTKLVECMKRICRLWLLSGMALMCTISGVAQQIVYANLSELLENRGDTVTTLRVEKRTKNQTYLVGGGDYKITAQGNRWLTRYLRKRCYAVRVDSALYVNCRKMHYKKFKMGTWYAPAIQICRHIYYKMQPVGQIAASTAMPTDVPRLGGNVGEAISAAGLVHKRVYYEIEPETGQTEFLGRKRMMELLKGNEDLQDEFSQEPDESAETMEKYLKQLECNTN